MYYNLHREESQEEEKEEKEEEEEEEEEEEGRYGMLKTNAFKIDGDNASRSLRLSIRAERLTNKSG